MKQGPQLWPQLFPLSELSTSEPSGKVAGSRPRESEEISGTDSAKRCWPHIKAFKLSGRRKGILRKK